MNVNIGPKPSPVPKAHQVRGNPPKPDTIPSTKDSYIPSQAEPALASQISKLSSLAIGHVFKPAAQSSPDPAAPLLGNPDIERIKKTQDPVQRNREITASYAKLSREMRDVIGKDGGANWATFGAWASDEAGKTIRGEQISNETQAVINIINPLAGLLTSEGEGNAQKQVAEGNRVVYREIAPAFAEFVDRFKSVETRSESSDKSLNAMLEGYKDKPKLKGAFKLYYQAKFEKDPNKKKELVHRANVLIGEHEQKRLQPYIKSAIPFGTRTAATSNMKLKLGKHKVELSEDLPGRPGTGASDWTDYDQRMRYIEALFQRHQSEPSLFDEPPGSAAPKSK
jgi:hypothetical protein